LRGAFYFPYLYVNDTVNRLPSAPNPVGNKKRISPRIGGPAWNKAVTFYETDLNLPGIDPATNNYPPGSTAIGISYYDPLDYYDTEGGSSYFEIIY
jgi:hypothetical protein